MTEQDTGVQNSEQDTEVSTMSTPSEDNKQDALVDATNPTETEVTESTEAKPEKISAFEKRINRMRAALGDKERQLLELSERVKSLEVKPQDTTQGPNEADFETTEEYLEARGAWKKEQEYLAKDQERAAQEKAEKYKADLIEKSNSFKKKEEDFRKVTPDYDDATSVLNEYVEFADKSTNEFQVFRDMLLTSDNLPALSYHLGKNPDVLEGFFKMNAPQMAREIAKIELKIASDVKPQTAKPIPEGISPVSGSTKTGKSIDQMSGRELLNWVKK